MIWGYHYFRKHPYQLVINVDSCGLSTSTTRDGLRNSPSTRQASKTIASFQQRSWMMNSWKERWHLVDRKPPKLPKLPTFQGIDENHLWRKLIWLESTRALNFHSQRGPVFRRVMMTLKELFGAHFCGNFSMPGEIQRMVSIQKGQAILFFGNFKRH